MNLILLVTRSIEHMWFGHINTVSFGPLLAGPNLIFDAVLVAAGVTSVDRSYRRQNPCRGIPLYHWDTPGAT